jgi:hypothetical protein
MDGSGPAAVRTGNVTGTPLPPDRGRLQQTQEFGSQTVARLAFLRLSALQLYEPFAAQPDGMEFWVLTELVVRKGSVPIGRAWFAPAKVWRAEPNRQLTRPSRRGE